MWKQIRGENSIPEFKLLKVFSAQLFEAHPASSNNQQSIDRPKNTMDIPSAAEPFLRRFHTTNKQLDFQEEARSRFFSDSSRSRNYYSYRAINRDRKKMQRCLRPAQET